MTSIPEKPAASFNSHKHPKMKSIKDEVKKMPKRIDEIVSDAKETMDETFFCL